MTKEELIKLANSSKATISEIKTFENKKGIKYADDHIDFLLITNGIEFPGPPYEYAAYNGVGALMQVLFDAETIYSYVKKYIDEENDNPSYNYQFSHCVIGEDLSGDEIIQITERGEYYGKVYMWDHESEAGLLEEPEEEIIETLDSIKSANEQIKYLTKIEAWDLAAESFTEFLEKIKKGE